MDTENETIDQQPEPEAVELELIGAGISLKRKIDMATALDVISVVLGGAPRPARESTGGALASRKQSGQKTGLSVGEAITESEAKTNAQRILAIGAWLEDESGQDSFTTAQVKQQFQKARHKTPANLPRDWNAAVKARWITESNEEAGQFYVTNTGRSTLEKGFSTK